MKELLNKFIEEIESLFIIYQFNVFGLAMVKEKWEEGKKINPEINGFVLTDSERTYELSADKRTFELGISEKGDFFHKLSCLFISSVYQVWEEKYRLKISELLQIKKNEVKSNLFGELRKVRQATVHNNFAKTNELQKLKILSFLIKNEGFRINSSDMLQIRDLIKKEMPNIEENLLKFSIP